MSNTYAWLADKKKQAMAEKLKRRGMPNYSQMPISERMGVSYTGTGADGKVDPTAPAGVGMGGDHIFHQGEVAANVPEGSMYVDAKTTQMAYPELQPGANVKPKGSVDQAQSDLYSKSGNLPGFKAGGFTPLSQRNKKPQNLAKSAAPNNVLDQNMPDAPITVKQGFRSGGFNPMPGNQPVNQGINPEMEIQPQARLAASRGFATGGAILPKPFSSVLSKVGKADNLVSTNNTTTSSSPTPAASQVNAGTSSVLSKVGKADNLVSTNIGADLGTTTNNTTTSSSIKVPDMVVDTSSGSTANSSVAKQAAAQNLAAQNQAPNLSIPTPAASQAATPAPAASQAATPAPAASQAATPAPAASQAPQTSALTALETQGRQAMNQLTTQQQQEQSALQQQLLQQGLSPNEIATQMQQLRNTQQTDQNNLASQFGISAQTEQTSEAWTAYNAAIAAGDTKAAETAYQQATGQSIDLTNMSKTQALNLSALQTQVGSASMTAINNAINNGETLDQINSSGLTNADGTPVKLTQDQFNNILNATPLGTQNYNRQMTLVQTDLTAGTPTSIQDAANVINNLYPGANVDFSALQTAAQSKEVASGMSTLSTYAQGNMAFDNIPASDLKSIEDQTGYTATQVETVYKGMTTNAIDAAWQVYSSSTAYTSLTPAQQAAATAYHVNSVLQNYTGGTMTNGYDTLDANGNIVGMYTTKAEADKAVTDAAANGQTLTSAAGPVITNEAAAIPGAGQDPNPVPSGLNPGDFYVSKSDNKLYQVGTTSTGGLQGNISSMPDPTAAWGTSADQIMALGGDQAQQITTMRANTLVDTTTGNIIQNGPWTQASFKSSSDPVYEATLEAATPMNLTTNKTNWQVTPTVGNVVKVPTGDGNYVLAKVASVGGDTTKVVTYTALDGSDDTITSEFVTENGSSTTLGSMTLNQIGVVGVEVSDSTGKEISVNTIK